MESGKLLDLKEKSAVESVKPGSHMRNKKSSTTETILVITDWPAYESHKL